MAVCGVDGVGKTTVARRLAAILGFQYMKTPRAEYQPLRSFYEGESVSVLSRFAFYLGALSESSDAIRRLCGNGLGVVADRYLLSLKIYHEVLSGKHLGDYIAPWNFIMPDLTVILTAPISVIESRLADRRPLRFDWRIESNVRLLAEVSDRFANTAGPAIRIVSADRPLAEVIAECVGAITTLSRVTGGGIKEVVAA